MIDGFDKMLAGSLKLEEPWYIKGANFDPDKHEIHIHVGVRKKASFAVGFQKLVYRLFETPQLAAMFTYSNSMDANY